VGAAAVVFDVVVGGENKPNTGASRSSLGEVVAAVVGCVVVGWWVVGAVVAGEPPMVVLIVVPLPLLKRPLSPSKRSRLIYVGK
jgi:hypothetical protein